MKLKLTWLTLLLAFVVQFSFAQEKTVSGNVVSAEDLLPLPGVNVIVVGTQRGTQTDFDGNYSLQVSSGEVLQFSFVGYATQNVTVGSSNTINVTMALDNTLEEVVIQAYRTSQKETSNIAAQTVTAKTIEARPNASFAQTLQGQIAGLNIVTATGQPGANSTINLRGVASVNGNTEPLFLIDGVPVDEDNFRSLNPNEIESVSVLKDAGATAIYGNRGANGVVIIKTKGGSYNQDLKISYVGTTSFSRLQDNDYDLMNSREQLELERTYGAGFGATLSDAELNLRAQQVNTEWLDVFFRVGLTQSHTLSFTSGGENLNSFTSLGFTDQEGILVQSRLKRFNFRNNLNGKSDNGKFNYGTSLSINYSENDEPNNIGGGGINRNYVLGAVAAVPYISPNSYVRGQGANIPVVFANTPLFLLDRLDTFERNLDEIKVIANLNASYNITDNLTFKTSFGADFTDVQSLRIESPIGFNEQLFAEPGRVNPGREDRQSTRTLAFNVNNALTYTNTFGKHTVEVSLLQEYFRAFYKTFGFRQEGFDPATYYPGDGSAYIADNGTDDFDADVANANILFAGLFSYFGYADYDYDKKYGLSATIRRDASYRFAASNRWGTFWSLAARWNISNEKFMENSKVFDALKLRGSYGTSGNQRIVDAVGQFAYFSAADLTQDFYVTGSQYGNNQGLSFGQIGNNDLQWETVVQANIGLDFEMFQRLRGSVDFYKKNTEDLFFPTPISPALNGGQTSISANVGELENRGVDLELHYDLFKSTKDGGFNMTLNFVGNYNKQEIIDLGPGGDQPFGLRVGGVLSEIYAAPYLGVNPANGNLLFLDIDGNITEDLVESDQRATGLNFYPDFQGSFGFDAEYKNFFLTTQFNYATGIYRFDFDLNGYMDPSNIGQFRHSRDILRAWSQPGDVTDVPSLFATNRADIGLSDMDLRESDYLRLRFIQFGYNLPSKYSDKLGFSYIRLFGSAENILTWSKWRGFDAEGVGSSQWEYPTPKTYTIGLEVGF